MRVTIDTEKSLVEITDMMENALEAIKAKFGWDGTAHALETSLLRLAVDDWGQKNSGSVGRLKRVQRAIKK